MNLGRFFRRYLSGDKFEYQGKEYQNYKVFLLIQTESIEPKASPLTPEMPVYFQYKNESRENGSG